MEYEYTRQQGHKLTYRVKLSITRNAMSGNLSYRATVYRPDGEYVGALRTRPLASIDDASAEAEARSFASADIENLVDICE
ncbi:MAG TPA: hypothetical protein VGM85_03545 [Paraburkholderia sp.]|jgi:hypothetical protein